MVSISPNLIFSDPAMTFDPNTNPLFTDQWYLKNTGQRGAPGIDINVTSLWSQYTGRGVIVAVNDDGMDLTHPDLMANVLPALTFDAARGTTGQGFAAADNSHGTVVGSIIGMANNGAGGIGVAFDAKLVAGLAIGSGVNYANLFLANLASGAGVSCNSWGQDPAFGENFGASGSASDQAWNAAMLRGVTEGRGGLGMVIEVSGGNERANMADVALSNFTGARYTIAVGAMDNVGKVTSYSTPGASLLVSAPGGVGNAEQSVNTGFGIVSADVVSDAGYNKTTGAAGDYSYQNQGTSYSGPMVAGVAALMLQANPSLGFRDVSTILAMTARQTDTGNSSWVATSGSTWNLGGMHFSRDYGFGLVDAKAAVHLAESWNVTAGTVVNWRSVDAVAAAGVSAIPENATGLTVSAPMAANISIERLEVLLELDASAPSQLRATLTSPGGTTVTLFDGPLTRELANGAPNMALPESAWPGVFSVGATAFLGEQSAGTWTIALFDKVAGITATYKSATVRAWGSEATPNTNLVFTDEFKGSKVLTDASGLDTVNAAAMTSSVAINLNSGAASTLPGGQFVIAAGTAIENAIGGDGNDALTGNAANNVFRGNRGNDTIDGGAGIDTAVFAGTRSGYTITVGGSTQVVSKSGVEGTDTLTAVERLRFSDTSVAIDLAPSGNAAKTAQFLGLLGPAFLSQKAVVGTVLGIFDQTGIDLAAAFNLVLGNGLVSQLAGGASDVALIKLIHRNLVGSEATDAVAATLAGQLLKDSGGTYSRVDLLNLGAGVDANLQRVGLVGNSGLMATGLEYA